MKGLHVTIIFILCCNALFSQENHNNTRQQVALDLFLLELQEQYKISISYDSKISDNQLVTIDIQGLTLKQIFSEVERQTALVFRELNPKNYILKTRDDNTSISICGYIVDTESNQKLSNVSIVQSVLNKGTYTDDKGFFQLENITKKDTIEIKLLGYGIKKLTPNAFETTHCSTIYLEEKAFQLNSITINGYFTPGFYKKDDGSILAIPKKTQLLPGLIEQDVMQALQLIPGIQSPDESATGIHIRGGTPDQNLILWDGIKMYQYDHFFGTLSSFNPNTIEEVKLFRNAASARYGNHLSGVIDIQSHSKIPERTQAGFGVNMIAVDAYLKTPLSKKTALFLTARRSYTDGLRSHTFDKFSEQVFQNTKITDNDETYSDALSKKNINYFFNDFTAKFVTKLNPSNTLSISGIYFKNKLNFLSLFEEINQRIEDRLDISNLGISTSWDKQWSPNLESKLSINYSDYKYSYDGDELLSNFFKYKIIKKNDIQDVSINLFTKFIIDKNQTLVNGYSSTNSKLNYTLIDQSKVIFDSDVFIDSQNAKNLVHSLFNEYNFSNDKWDINTGIRTDYNTTISKFYFQPTASITRRLNKRLKLNVSLEKQYQYISQIVEFETKKFGLENQVWTVANNVEIPVLESNQFSLSGDFNKNNWQINIEAYLKNIKNITSVTKGFNREVNTFSIGNSAVKGVDVLVKKRIANFSSLVSYSLTQNDFEFDNLNDNIPFSGNFDIRHHLTLIQSIKINNLELALGWRFKSPRPFTPANGLIGDNADNIVINYGAINSKYLNQYHRLDFSAKYVLIPFKNRSTKATLAFSLLNIYNRKSVLNRAYRIILNTENAGYELRETNKFSLGRIPNLSFRLDF